MMKKHDKVVIFGLGAFAQVARVYLACDSPYEVVAFTVDRAYMNGEIAYGLPVVAFEEVERAYPPDQYDMLVAIGYGEGNALRAEKYEEAKAKGYELITYVNSRTAIWGEVEIGDNCFIFENETIQPFVKIGNDVVIWSGNHIGHHSTIGDHCFISSHVVISGGATVGPYSFLGVNSSLRDGVRIAKGSVIGMGAVVVKDTEENCTYIGVAAKRYEKEVKQA
jgi:sugar O-acyltransferase (sialic acid O-acetyltransferase NeuD family)